MHVFIRIHLWKLKRIKFQTIVMSMIQIPKNYHPSFWVSKFCVNSTGEKIIISQKKFWIFFIVPGCGGNKLKAVLNKKTVPHYFCYKTTSKQDPYDLWLNPLQFVPLVIDCWVSVKLQTKIHFFFFSLNLVTNILSLIFFFRYFLK